jgi:nicotinate-nucleotide adenylyltransferase
MKTCKLCQDRSSKFGLFGGTFNPIHSGHIQVALDVLCGFDLDRIYFIPSALPPHKHDVMLASAEDRLQMVRLALEGRKRFQACNIEIERTGPSYSIDTVRHFETVAAGQNQLYFVLGVDAFLEIHTWKEFDRLFEHTAMIVMSRPGSGQWSKPVRRQVEIYIRHHIDKGYDLNAAGTEMNHPHMGTIHFASVTPLDISSSQIRSRIAQGHSIKDLVPPPVAEYIKKKRLFNE